MKLFDPTKPVQTRDGKPARILCTDFKSNDHDLPIAAAVMLEYGNEAVCFYTVSGLFHDNALFSSLDLVNVPVEHAREFWVNFYPEKSHSATGLHCSKETADKHGAHDRIACVKVSVTFKEGGGL